MSSFDLVYPVMSRLGRLLNYSQPPVKRHIIIYQPLYGAVHLGYRPLKSRYAILERLDNRVIEHRCDKRYYGYQLHRCSQI